MVEFASKMTELVSRDETDLLVSEVKAQADHLQTSQIPPYSHHYSTNNYFTL